VADFYERQVTRTFTEWCIPVRSLGGLPEWAKLQNAIAQTIGAELAEQHGVLESRIEGDDDDQTLVLSFEHKPRTIAEVVSRDVERGLTELAGSGVLTARAFLSEARRRGGFFMGSIDTPRRLAALLGDKVSTDADLATMVDGVTHMFDQKLGRNGLRIGSVYYTLEPTGAIAPVLASGN
jgi:hypothetical protein